jgi:hypothetical protein
VIHHCLTLIALTRRNELTERSEKVLLMAKRIARAMRSASGVRILRLESQFGQRQQQPDPAMARLSCCAFFLGNLTIFELTCRSCGYTEKREQEA